MRTLLREQKISAMIAVRNDAVIYVAEKGSKVPKTSYFDELFEAELKELSDNTIRGEVYAADRGIMREEIIVDGLLKKYTKVGKLVEIDGKK